ncbi:YqcI/YcgG family protein [Streptomyces chitinivorans]|uniref:YqcI/YcgG family protein n=1 Tax=Streptomyces chitinivorans TaxID=1257027 RepID=A0ABW7HT57_9ACTN|nr:YqcI/YcgG family protein [Streptomyces chitinivorans]MDH2410239.1 YqcI/YcgG family protein [Streptomyces chitinivorans]
MTDSAPIPFSEPSALPLTTPAVCDPRQPREKAWEADAVERFRKRMLDESTLFPCVFGVDALRRAALRFSFLERGDGLARRLAAALGGFVALAPELGRRTSLVAFFETTDEDRARDVEGFRTLVWGLLQAVHDLGTAPWPADIPAGTWITLPAGTVHGSLTGPRGAVYMIRPRDGRTAETTFLADGEHPHPTPVARESAA